MMGWRLSNRRPEKHCSTASKKNDNHYAVHAEEEESTRSSAVDANIRVGVGLLDKLMDLVGELVLARNQILQFNAERDDPALNSTSQRLNLITSELQEGVMKTRMQPIGIVWQISRVLFAICQSRSVKSKSRWMGRILNLIAQLSRLSRIR